MTQNQKLQAKFKSEIDALKQEREAYRNESVTIICDGDNRRFCAIV